jgi:hypothetical protein
MAKTRKTRARPMTGGCLCGAVRYTAKGKPDHMGHCHCSMCRKSTGAAFGTFAGFPSSHVRFTKGKPKYFRSSKWAARGFCAQCGGTLVYKLVKDDTKIWLSIGSMDDLGAVKPEMHIFTAGMAPWLKLADKLPRHKAMPPA